MRPILAILVGFVILIGVRQFIAGNSSSDVVALTQEAESAGQFSVEVLTTFDAGADPFALNADQSSSLTVEFRGKTLIDIRKPLEAGSLSIAEDVGAVMQGKNEFFVTATPATESVDLVHAVRVRILRDGEAVTEAWIASDPGMPVSDRVALDLP